MTVNCATDCINGCILGEKCPNLQYVKAASQFIRNTSLDRMLEIAEERFRKKGSDPPRWVFPEDDSQNLG
jgi:hypothetical protein